MHHGDFVKYTAAITATDVAIHATGSLCLFMYISFKYKNNYIGKVYIYNIFKLCSGKSN